MIKFLYVVSLGITSFLLFIFSKEKDDFVCNNQALGKIELVIDSSGSYLCVVTENNEVLHPVSMSEDIVLTAGQKVAVCYTIDSLKDSSKFTAADAPAQINIKSINYIP